MVLGQCRRRCCCVPVVHSVSRRGGVTRSFLVVSIERFYSLVGRWSPYIVCGEGTCMAYAWHMHGMCLACAWHIYGPRLIAYISFRIHGVPFCIGVEIMERTRDSLGLFEDSGANSIAWQAIIRTPSYIPYYMYIRHHQEHTEFK